MDKDYGGSCLLYPIILKDAGEFNYPVIVETLPRNYFSIVMKLLTKHYIPKYHLWKLIGFTRAGFEEYLETVFSWLSQGTSLIAVEPPTGRVLGFLIGTVEDTKGNRGKMIQKELIKYETAEVQAMVNLYDFLHQNIDFSLVFNADLLYNIHVWLVVPKVVRKSRILYEMYTSLLKFCELLDINAVAAVVCRKTEKNFAECFGFQKIKQVCYSNFFKEYDLNEAALERECHAFFLSFLCSDIREYENYVYNNGWFSLPKLTKDKKKLEDKTYWEHLFWKELGKDFLTPNIIKKHNLGNVII